MGMDNIKRILFISLSNLGDIVLTTPVLTVLEHRFPGARVDVLCGPSGKDIFSVHSMVDNVFVTKDHRTLKGRLKLVLQLRKQHYDLVVDLKNTFLPMILPKKISTRFSFGGSYRNIHKKDFHLGKLAELGLVTDDAGFFIPSSHDDKVHVDKMLSENRIKGFIVFIPGAKSHLKRWPHDKYAELGRKIIDMGYTVVLAGDSNDIEISGKVASQVKKNIIDLSGKTSISELAELLRRSMLVVTNDSAPLHIASALNVPTVALFGPTDAVFYGPLSEDSNVVTSHKKCRPCGKALCVHDPAKGCMDTIAVDEVLSAVKNIIERTDDRS